MVGIWLQPDLNAILSIFSLYADVILGYPRRHAAFPVRRHAFLLMFCVTRPTDLDRHKT